MKLVLLPGMDGTGKLFKDFIESWQGECLVLNLPALGDQSHQVLAETIVNRLPKQDYALVAESFSGGLVPFLIQRAAVKPKAIILAASFLHSPRPLLSKLACYLPLKKLIKIPITKWIIQYTCMNKSSAHQFQQFWTLLCSLNMDLMKRRLQIIRKMDIQPHNTSIPTLYLMAAQDKLVPYHLSNQLIKCFSRLKIQSIAGPHFIMQTNPAACAQEIAFFIKEVGDANV